jgi:hypothetical protein
MLHKNNQTKAVLVRMPIELFRLVEKSAKEHRRSNTQELIVAIENGLTATLTPIREPHRLAFRKKISKKDLLDAIDEGRE